MKLLRRITLAFREGKSDKIYEVDLCEVGNNQYVVNFRFGRRGSALKDGSKTPIPVTLPQAEKEYAKLVDSKLKKGYWDTSQAPPPAKAAKKYSAPDSTNPRQDIILAQLRDAVENHGKEGGRSLDRLLWSVGRLRLQAATPLLQQVARWPKRKGMTDYCLAWALGRCGDDEALPILKEMWLNNEAPDPIKWVAKEAYRNLATGTQKEAFSAEIIAALPAPIQQLILNNGTVPQLQSQLDLYLQNATPAQFEVIPQLFLLDHANVRGTLLEWIKTAPFIPNYFKQMRRLYKAAEFRLDAEAFGLLLYRFEKEKPYTITSSSDAAHCYVGGRRIHIGKEAAKNDSRVAFTKKTKNYFRRRAWYTLRGFAESQGEDYIKMAIGILQPMTDDDAGRVFSNNYHHYDLYAQFYNFNAILFLNSSRYQPNPNRLNWVCRDSYRPGQPPPPEREEAFPELWDRFPEPLLFLLSQNQCFLVHHFGVKVLRANGKFCHSLDGPAIAMLLARPYDVTQELGLELAQQKLDDGDPDMYLLVALLCCQLPEARTLAHQVIDRAFFPPQAKEALVYIILNTMLDMTEPNQGKKATELGEVLFKFFQNILFGLDFETIQRLLQHPFPENQVFAGQVLVAHHTPAEDWPDWIFQQLLQSPHDNVRRVGVTLFGKLPLETLFEKEAMVLGFCLSAFAGMREAVRPILQKMATANPEFAVLLIKTLCHHLLIKEPVAHYYKDLIVILQEYVVAFLHTMEQDMMLRLLKSRDVVVQSFGGYVLLQFFSPDSFSVRQMMTFSHHEIQAVRVFAQEWCLKNVPQLKAAMMDTLRVFDTHWEDTIQLGFTLFRDMFTPADLSPEVLVGICDSVSPHVQAFGCDLITRFFHEEDGTAYLLKLSEHPSQNLQLFVSNYLSRYATGSVQRIAQLEDYFVRVLCLINKARVTKQRILAFFKEEAGANPEIADIIARILNRVSLTMAIGNKASYIELLRDIRRVFPATVNVISLRQPPLRQGRVHGI